MLTSSWALGFTAAAIALGVFRGKKTILSVMMLFKHIRVGWLRLRGLTPDSLAERRVATGQSWEEFCDTLKAAGAVMHWPGTPTDPLTQAEGYRYLSRLTRAALENFLECADTEAPRLCAIANGNRAAPIKIGSDNPDNLYESAVISSAQRYLVRGSRGTVGYLGLGTQAGAYGSAGGLRTVDYREDGALQMGADGTLEVLLAATQSEPPAANWLRLDPTEMQAMFIVRYVDRGSNAGPSLIALPAPCRFD